MCEDSIKTMSSSVELTSQRLCIEPFSEKFLTQKYVDWLNDPDVVRFSVQRHRIHTLESCRDYMRSYIGTPSYFWAIIERVQGFGHIGNIHAHVHPRDRIADVGIFIGNKAAWGHGFASEAWMSVCCFLFEQINIRKITAGTCSANLAMIGVMKSTGMIDDGRRVRQTIVDGVEVDIVHAALFSDSWVAPRKSC